MLGDDAIAQSAIEKHLIVDDDGQEARLKCPVPVCEANVVFTLQDGEYQRNGSCAVVMSRLTSS